MKKWIPAFIVAAALLLLMILPVLPTLARQEPRAPASSLMAMYPGAQIIVQTADADDAFFVLTDADGVQRLCILQLKRGAWRMAAQSASALLPAGKSGYDWISLMWNDPMLAVSYDEGKAEWQQHVFRREEGRWCFDALALHRTAPSQTALLRPVGEHLLVFPVMPSGAAAAYPTAAMPAPGIAAHLTLDDFDASTLPASFALSLCLRGVGVVPRGLVYAGADAALPALPDAK